MGHHVVEFSPDEMVIIYRALMTAYCVFYKWETDERKKKIPDAEHIKDTGESRRGVKALLDRLHEIEPGFLLDLDEFFRDFEI